jgi:hypothetical protein
MRRPEITVKDAMAYSTRHSVSLKQAVAALGAKMTWRDSRSLAGVRSQLVAAINACDDGAYVQVDMSTARNLVQVCDQAIHTEEGHGT